MAEIIGLPKLSPTMEEGVLVRWVKKEGDAIEPGDLVAEIETDKANMDFNIEDEGVLLKLLVAEGETVALGAPVAILGQAGEDISALVAEANQAGPAVNPPTTASAPAPAVVTPVAVAPAPSSATTVPAPAVSSPPTVAPPAVPAAVAAPQTASSGRLLASPLAKTLAVELGLDLQNMTGSGPGGRIVERDVRAAASADLQASAETSPSPAAAADTSTALAVVAAAPPATIPASDQYVDRPMSNMRKRIAERMTAAKRDTPHFYLSREFDVENMLAFRKRLNGLLGDRGKVSVNDLIVKGAALALRRVPDCNVAIVGDSIRYYTGVHIGIAVATDRGLVTPVVRNADLKGIGVIAHEIRELAQRARDRALKTHEIQGSTFTVSNLGMFGIREFSAIINPPEAAILAVGTIADVPVVKDNQVVPGKRMSLSVSCDHRVVDGALGAMFLRELVSILEQPESLAL